MKVEQVEGRALHCLGQQRATNHWVFKRGAQVQGHLCSTKRQKKTVSVGSPY